MNKKVKATIIKHIEENIGEKSLWPWDRQSFPGTAPKMQSIKKKGIN